MQRTAALLSLALVSACAPTKDDGDDTDTSETTTADSTDATSGADATTEAVTTTDAVPTTDAEPTGTSVADTDDPTTGGEDATVQAWLLPNEDMRLRVIQVDPETGLCRAVFLDDGGTETKMYAAVERPDGWDVSAVFVFQSDKDCFNPLLQFAQEPVHATSATGSVTFNDVGAAGEPVSLSLTVTGTYAPGEPWVPAMATLTADGLTVETL